MIENWQAVLDHLRVTAGFDATESFRVLHLDAKNHLIRDELCATGTIDQCPVFPREVVRRALDHGATALILIHNHPTGDTAPSSSDIRITRAITAAANVFGIAVLDHLIVGRHGHTSMKAEGCW